jgi:hypothetical protein
VRFVQVNRFYCLKDFAAGTQPILFPRQLRLDARTEALQGIDAAGELSQRHNGGGGPGPFIRAGRGGTEEKAQCTARRPVGDLTDFQELPCTSIRGDSQAAVSVELLSPAGHAYRQGKRLQQQLRRG